MKIALLTEKYTPDIGGLAISSGRLGDSLAAAGYEVRLFSPTLSLPPAIQHTQRSNQIHVTRFGAHKRTDDTLLNWFELVTKEHQRTPFDLIQAYFLPKAGFVGAYAGKFLNIPVVTSIRGNDIERALFDPSAFSHISYALQQASAITTNASILAQKAKAVINREIHIIPNGIDTSHFRPLPKNENLLSLVTVSPTNMPIIGFAGELREKKGLSTLLGGYAKLFKHMPAILLIVGTLRDGDDKKYFEEFTQSNPHLPIRVTGHVPHKDLPAYYALMDVFVHLSQRDGMPNAILEAQACGIPVIATRTGGMLDCIKNEVTGFLIDVGDEASFAKKAFEVLQKPTESRTISNAAREAVLHQYTLEKELQANLNIYQKLGVKL